MLIELYNVIIMSVKNNLQKARKRLGLSQNEVAVSVGITRQAYIAIELGRAVPSTQVALKIGKILCSKIEDLFYLEDNEEFVTSADLAGDIPVQNGTRLQLVEIGSRVIARPLVGDYAVTRFFNLANAVATENSGTGKTVQARLTRSPLEKTPTLVILGGDPSIAVLASMLQERGVRVFWTELPSIAAIRALARGEAHV
ncbi:MAG TPA: helix-turn-helix domain-containing protein, partial [Candidatus Limnocylindrales bacterium]|nr:helix-turn-helix domain-containing protein [Candidatus Limnocylindrales bacterium]